MNWQRLAAYTYITICIFDFMIVPMWFGIVRASINPLELLKQVSAFELDASTQLAIVQAYTFQHMPFTLQGGGLFHLAFGALLTGTTIFSHKKN